MKLYALFYVSFQKSHRQAHMFHETYTRLTWHHLICAFFSNIKKMLKRLRKLKCEFNHCLIVIGFGPENIWAFPWNPFEHENIVSGSSSEFYCLWKSPSVRRDLQVSFILILREMYAANFKVHHSCRTQISTISTDKFKILNFIFIPMSPCPCCSQSSRKSEENY